MHEKLLKISRIFAANFAVENFDLFIYDSMIAIGLKFTQKGD